MTLCACGELIAAVLGGPQTSPVVATWRDVDVVCVDACRPLGWSRVGGKGEGWMFGWGGLTTPELKSKAQPDILCCAILV